MSDPGFPGPDAILARCQDIIASDMDGEIVILSISSGAYYSLHGVGSAVWNALDQPLSFADLVTRLVEDFEVTEEQCRAETAEFLREMLAEGVLRIQSPEGP